MMPWLRVNQSRQLPEYAVPSPSFALDVQRGAIPGAPNAEPLIPVFMVREAASPNQRSSQPELEILIFRRSEARPVGVHKYLLLRELFK